MKIVASYLNFVFHIEVKSKSNHKFLNFVFQFIKNTKWHFGYTDSVAHSLKYNFVTVIFQVKYVNRQLFLSQIIGYMGQSNVDVMLLY